MTGGVAECVEACLSDEDCTNATSGLFAPFCNTTSGECVACKQDSDCLNSVAFPNTTYCFNDNGLTFGGNICSASPSPFCSTTADCTTFGGDYSCIQYTSDIAQNFGYCVNTSNAGSCTSQSDCVDGGIFGKQPLFSKLDISCTPLTVPANISGTIYSATLSFCIPQDQCTMDSQCLTGSECRKFNFENTFGFNICFLSNNTCSTNTDCNADGSDGPLACYTKDKTCYLPCTSNEECVNDNVNNWACGSPPNTTEPIQGCIPLGLPNATYLTNSPTVSPVDGINGVKSLQIFAAFIIMVINSILCVN